MPPSQTPPQNEMPARPPVPAPARDVGRSRPAGESGPPPHWLWRTRLPVWVGAVVVAVIQVMGSTGAQEAAPRGPHPYFPTPLDAFGYALLLAGPVALLARRRQPMVSLTVGAAVTLLYYLRAYAYGPAFVTAAVAMGSALTAGHRRTVWIGTFAGFAGFFALATVIGLSPERSGAASDRLFPVERPDLFVMTFVLAWGLVVLTGAEIVRFTRERAAQAARTRAEQERRQASDERLRIARELHDVLAHNISMINVQAGVALHLMDERPGPAGAAAAQVALAAIKEASKEALTEMRSVIGALRQQGADSAPRTPIAGLARLDELIGRARAAGLTVHVEIQGAARQLTAGVDLAAFRIIQESLTNVTRHAGPGPVTAWVRIAYGEGDVLVEIDDDGRGGVLLADDSGGSGLPGMRERAAALAGEFSAGPRPGGGFRVRARLPLTEDASAETNVGATGMETRETR